MINRYYSPRQYNRMKELDQTGLMRDERRDRNSPLICVQCGSVDYFIFKTRINDRISIDRNGILVLEPTDQCTKLSQLNHNRGSNNIIAAICARCNGPAVLRSEVQTRCREKGCLGCMICGVVMLQAEVERQISNCVDCFGGELECVDGCPRQFMRKYYATRRIIQNQEGA